ncbi:MAG: DUF72 domain-containing protein, partial [Candidatus Jordarchaeum sp.]|uniref:DUF72 domain-containing protein n=1 Tax=Candidatus Jordarchaeum sp. TaxID=2823881 RepID=UPI0040490447
VQEWYYLSLNLSTVVNPLAKSGKLGGYLIQLPPKMKFDQSKAEAFYTLLPEKYKFAIEFRNSTWLSDQSIKLLSKYNIAYTVLDEPLLPPDIKITANFTYFRWHGRGREPWYDYLYTQDELKEWIPKIQEAQESVNEFYGYFNNHYHGYAPENCLDILEMLGISTPVQKQTRERIKQYRKGPPKPAPTPITLLDFMEEKPKETVEEEVKMEENIESLLRIFADEGRILRGRVMKSDEVKEVKIENQKISAKMRDYSILIDQGEKIIEHNCDDWKRRKNQKKFCKHIVKLFLTLPEKKSEKILRNISQNLNEWRFE